jgi:hypothetical protein
MNLIPKISARENLSTWAASYKHVNFAVNIGELPVANYDEPVFFS